MIKLLKGMMFMEALTLETINHILYQSYQTQKQRYKQGLEIPEQLSHAWDFIDHLFILEKKSKGSNYYEILTFIIPLLKPKNKEEEHHVFSLYLQLLGISSESENYQAIDYYFISHQKTLDIDWF